MKTNFINTLIAEAQNNGIKLSEEVANDLSIYKDMLLEWNEKMNLTAITEEKEIIIKHFVDCLECTKHLNDKQKVIDIGTGAGFPGIVIAIFFRGCSKITLVDSLNKRITFLNEVVNKLNIKNVEVLHKRAEELVKESGYRESFDVAVSRAVANLSVLLEYTIPYLKIGGRGLYMKGDRLSEELLGAKNAIDTLNLKHINTHNYNLKLNNENFSRTIAEFEKVKSTKGIYPRSYGKIKANPL